MPLSGITGRDVFNFQNNSQMVQRHLSGQECVLKLQSICVLFVESTCGSSQLSAAPVSRERTSFSGPSTLSHLYLGTYTLSYRPIHDPPLKIQ